MAKTLWYRGVCDSMLEKVKYWARAWPGGEVYAVDQCWSIEQGSYEKVSMRVVRVPWTAAEVEHLLRILEAVRPEWAMTASLKKAFQHFERCRLLPGGLRLVAHASYGDDPRELYRVLVEARDGVPDLAREMEEVLAQKGAGPLWS